MRLFRRIYRMTVNKSMRCQTLSTQDIKSVIAISKQSWKLFVSFVGALICFCIMVYGIGRHLNDKSDLALMLDLYGLAGTICSAIFGCLFIRCPKCGLRWLWYAVTKQNINGWFPWLVTLQQCPNCDFPLKK